MRLRPVNIKRKPGLDEKNRLGIRFELLGVTPTVWRTLVVREAITLSTLWKAISIAFDITEPSTVRFERGSSILEEHVAVEAAFGAVGNRALCSITLANGESFFLGIEVLVSEPQDSDEPRLAFCSGGEGGLISADVECNLNEVNERLRGGGAPLM